MKPVITPEESSRLDATASVPVDTLMDRAGYAVAVAAAAMGAGYGRRVVVLAGKGNNGGDGLVAARHLRRRGAQVRVVTYGTPGAGTPAERARRTAEAHGVDVGPWRAPFPGEAPDLIIDALFGAGFAGRLPNDMLQWLGVDAPVLAVDIPSGVDAATGTVDGEAFTATRTVALHALKTGQLLGEGPDRCGEITVADIGLDGEQAALWLCEEADARRPPRMRTTHKWSAGSVVVVGGSPGLTGAPLLSAVAALRGGAGAVTLMVPAELQSVYAVQSPELMSRGVGRGHTFRTEDVDEVLTAAERFDVLLLGPGLGLEVGRFVHQMVLRWPGRLVLDADGLNALDGIGTLVARQSPTILTPHEGEYRRLTDRHPDVDNAAELAARTRSTVLVKGSPTLVMGAQRWVVTSGGPELATIGSGDVLGGFIAALWARGLDADSAARSGAYWHGRAGAALAASGSVTADALATEIGRYAW